MSPETGLSLRRQTAGCGLVLIDSFCPLPFMFLAYYKTIHSGESVRGNYEKNTLLSLALLVTNTSLQAQTIAVDTDIQEVLVSASLVPIAVSRSGNAVTIIDREQLKTVQR